MFDVSKSERRDDYLKIGCTFFVKGENCWDARNNFTLVRNGEDLRYIQGQHLNLLI